jgi:hypothetical protein
MLHLEGLESRRLLATTSTFLSDLQPAVTPLNGWGPIEKDESNGEQSAHDGRTMALNSRTYAKGLGVHADSEVDYDFASSSGHTNFRADVGVDDEVGDKGSVVFQVWIDNAKVYDSGVMTGNTATGQVDIDITNVTARLRLIVLGTGDGHDFDHADWANARFDAVPQPPPVQPTLSFGQHTTEYPTEAGGSQTFVISRDGSFTNPLTVNFSTFGTAARGSDYELRTMDGTLITGNAFSFPANTPTYQFKVVGLQDGIVEPNEALTITLDQGSGYTVGSQSSDSTYIEDDDGPPPDTFYISDLRPTMSVNGWGPVEHDSSNGEQPAGDGQRIILNGTPFDKGIGVHAGSDVTYELNQHYETFLAVVGVDDEVGNNGSVDFQLFADGTKIYDSGIRRGADAGLPVSVNVHGVEQLRLVVSDGGDGNTFDHADWADARLILSHTSPYQISMTNRFAYEGGEERIIIDVDGTAAGPDPLSFDYETYDITAKANEDYVPVSGHFTVQPGQFFIDSVYISMLNDHVAEAAETFGIRIFNISGNAIVRPNSGIMEVRENPLNAPLSALTPSSQTNGWGPFEFNTSNGEIAAGDGKPMTLNGETFTSGLGVHANSELNYNISNRSHFYSTVGVDDEVGDNGSVIFQVYLDGVKKFDSGVLTGSSASRFVDLDIAGATNLRLVVTDAGNGNTFDHADWGGAVLT